jgi:hypothetical protein
MWRRPLFGLLGGALFYLPQTVAYFSPTASLFLRAGFNLTISLKIGNGLLAFNILAIGLTFLHLMAANRKWKREADAQAAADGELMSGAANHGR